MSNKHSLDKSHKTDVGDKQFPANFGAIKHKLSQIAAEKAFAEPGNVRYQVQDSNY